MKEFVAHRAANDARLFTAAVEQCKQPGDFILREPSCVGDLRERRHRVVPGTNFPFSMCAGT